ncbi:MAG: hypothetical protein LBE08_08960 [Bifidobacteriaceae bacterium]|jgi:hypothetical protein|nr:hypothetical protein [Bifidobacteriaceae bacterium]
MRSPVDRTGVPASAQEYLIQHLLESFLDGQAPPVAFCLDRIFARSPV